MISGEVAWASLASRILVADLLGDRENAIVLLEQLLADHPERLRSALLVWCDTAIQAAQVLPPDGFPAAVPRWAGELLAARSTGDGATVRHLLTVFESSADSWVRVLGLLDACGELVVAASTPQLSARCAAAATA